MKFLKDNWYKITLLTLAVVFLLIYFEQSNSVNKLLKDQNKHLETIAQTQENEPYVCIGNGYVYRWESKNSLASWFRYDRPYYEPQKKRIP